VLPGQVPVAFEDLGTHRRIQAQKLRQIFGLPAFKLVVAKVRLLSKQSTREAAKQTGVSQTARAQTRRPLCDAGTKEGLSGETFQTFGKPKPHLCTSGMPARSIRRYQRALCDRRICARRVLVNPDSSTGRNPDRSGTDDGIGATDTHLGAGNSGSAGSSSR
jgi:hypothetical protein